METGRRHLGEVVPLDVEHPREGERARAFARNVVRPVGGVQLLDGVLRIVLDHQPQRPQHALHPRGLGVEIVAQGVLELADVDGAVALRHPHRVAEGAHRLRRRPPPSQPGQRRHARVVPAGDQPPLDELQQLALAHQRVGEVEARELDLARARRHRGVGHHPVVELAVVLELQGAERVGDPLDRVRQRVREVVHRVEAPGVAGAVVRGVADAVEERIAHLHVRRGHVDLRPHHVRAVGELAGAHAGEQVEVLRRRAVAIGAGAARLGDRAPVGADLLLREAVDVGLAGLDQLHREVVEALEVVRGEVQAVPLEAEPAHVALDRLDVLHVLGGRVGVVEAEVAACRRISRATPKLRQIDLAWPMWR